MPPSICDSNRGIALYLSTITSLIYTQGCTALPPQCLSEAQQWAFMMALCTLFISCPKVASVSNTFPYSPSIWLDWSSWKCPSKHPNMFLFPLKWIFFSKMWILTMTNSPKGVGGCNIPLFTSILHWLLSALWSTLLDATVIFSINVYISDQSTPRSI